VEQVELSFVIPAYNEEESIQTTLIALDNIVKAKKLVYEIVVVNDGSKDGTLSKAINYANKNGHVHIISYEKNIGKGFAVKTGFLRSTGGIVVFADGDLDIDLDLVSRYVDALQHGDIVIASKWHPNSVVDIPLSRKLLSHGFNILVRLLTGIKLTDTQVGLKAMKKSAFTDIFPRLTVRRYAFDVELLAVAHLHGLRIVEMPTNLKIENSSIRIIDVWRMFEDLLGIAYRLRILHWYE
jgi:glycosyltransferase involved in cell wall biosynthesis